MCTVCIPDECGIVAQVSAPLAHAEISTYYICTFFTDHTLVRYTSHSWLGCPSCCMWYAEISAQERGVKQFCIYLSRPHYGACVLRVNVPSRFVLYVAIQHKWLDESHPQILGPGTHGNNELYILLHLHWSMKCHLTVSGTYVSFMMALSFSPLCVCICA